VKEYPKERESVMQFKEETSSRISKLDKDIAALKIKINNGNEAIKDEYRNAVANLERQSHELKVKLNDFKYKENLKLYDFKQEMNRNLDDLGKAISNMGKINSK
jgi:hypothetical protein